SFEPNQPVKAKMIVEKVKESEPSTEIERKQIEKEPAIIKEGGEQTEERTKTEAQLQVQAQAYAALEEQFKVEKQARLKAQQEAEAQSKQRAIIEAEYAEAQSAAKAKATEEADLHAAAIRELEQKLESLAEELTKAEANAESYAATIKQLEEKLKVQTEKAVKTEEHLQAQAQAYTALEEQLKAEKQARLKAQQEAQTQTHAKATPEAVTIDQATQNETDELIKPHGNKEQTIQNSTVEELEQTGEPAIPSPINPNTPKEKIIDIGNGVSMEFVLIPVGKFKMGSPSTESDRDTDEGPVHWVIISRPFYMGKYEVTQEQYYAVAKYKPSRFKQENGPVERVSWEQADRFCTKLSEIKDGNYRLPTEAEWEYACRAGSEDRFYFGLDPEYSQIEKYAWYSENSDSTTHPVGEKKPNSFGLYDMHGNVSEWCWDWYAPNYYHKTFMIDPPGPQNGKSRVIRGGSWFHGVRDCRSASRSSCEPVYIRNYVGFRVVLEIE
ncbi:SUMF1/EgtB/PvdO family nonheme iron enzyme, partial [Candidatus Woesearchaeota archaeon]|nr:SUMF1/EgtB/PvdO family nonheme iron enzyme [Candidatus Woesearchaeota archaeon]